MSTKAPKGAQLFDHYYSGPLVSTASPGDVSSAYDELENTSFATKVQTLSGSVQVGDISVEKFASAGSLAVAESARAATFQTSGSATIGRNLVAMQVISSGSLHVRGQLVAGTISSSGTLAVDGGIRTQDFLETSGFIRAPWIRSKGRVEISGRIETGVLVCDDLSISGGGIVSEAAGGTIEINTRTHFRIRGLLSLRTGKDDNPFKADSLTATGGVSLDRCEVGKVHGGMVRVGANSRIGEVEYTTGCEVEKGATIDTPPRRV